MDKKILLVEDEKALLDLMALQLEERCDAQVVKCFFPVTGNNVQKGKKFMCFCIVWIQFNRPVHFPERFPVIGLYKEGLIG